MDRHPAAAELPRADGAGKLAARVARRIERDVVRAGWPVGQVFGSEADLRERYQVSRAVLREAIRLLEHHQVACMRRGPSGGLVIRAPDAGPATNAMVVYLQFAGSTIAHLLAARLVIEPLAAILAAERIDEAGIVTLRAALAEQVAAEPDRDAGARDQLRLVIATLSGNPVLGLLVDVLVRLTRRYVPETFHIAPAGARRASDDAHACLVRAIVAGDSSKAERLVTQHLEAVRAFLVQRPAALPDRQPGRTAANLGQRQSQKLAEVLGQRILAEITDGGWPVGAVIGSEQALLERFAVGRSVLREAVRLLEYHSVARMRRGPHGGLVVAQPDPSASIAATALYLDFQGISGEALREVRAPVELACLDLLATRSGEPDLARRLRSTVHDEKLDESGSDPQLIRPHHLLHLELAEQAGNPVLALFLRILVTLAGRKQVSVLPSAPDDVSIDQVHHRILDALQAGDPELARHRLRRHLRDQTQWWQ